MGIGRVIIIWSRSTKRPHRTVLVLNTAIVCLCEAHNCIRRHTTRMHFSFLNIDLKLNWKRKNADNEEPTNRFWCVEWQQSGCFDWNRDEWDLWQHTDRWHIYCVKSTRRRTIVFNTPCTAVMSTFTVTITINWNKRDYTKCGVGLTPPFSDQQQSRSNSIICRCDNENWLLLRYH